MKVKDQIGLRMKQLNIDIPELARRCEVTHQTVRHWLAGRNYPKKGHALAVEKALSIKLDFSEGKTKKPGIDEVVNDMDLEAYNLIMSLPPKVKQNLIDMARSMINMKPE